MINKIFVFWGLSLAAILIVENMVTWMTAYVFIDSGAKTWFLSFVSVIVWIFIWYWIRWMFEKDTWDDENYDF
jgi:hypothetical protein